MRFMLRVLIKRYNFETRVLKREIMKANIEISEETMNGLSGALDLSPLYDEEYGVDEDGLSYAIELMVRLCVD